ncbi:MAG: hypothetical protein JNL94_07025 [Planctomycetes bacterium]|nr:hypothetical protein [Planctomycetota bacterium]
MGIVASIGLCSVLAFASEDRVALHLSFDGTGKATEGWKAGGKGKIHVKAVGSDPSGPASSRHLSIDAEPSTALQTKSIELPDLSRCSDVELRVRSSSATPSEPTVLEVQCFTPNHGWFWRRLDVRAGDEFTTVRLPLRWFRTSRDSVPRWNEVDAFGIWFRNGGTVEIDDIKWIDGGRADAAERSLDEIAAEAFSTATEPKRAERRGVVVMTDDPALPADAVLDAIDAMRAGVERDIPGHGSPWRPVVLLVFAQDADYRAFWPRFAARFASDIEAPKSDGFTSAGIASAAAAPDGRLRPVFVHEATHAYLEQVLRLDHTQNWLQEGLAVRYQAAFMGEDFGPTMRRRIADPAKHPSLARLTDGRELRSTEYAQAGSFLEWLLDDPKRAEGLRKAIPAMVKARSTALEPHANAILGASLDELEAQWMAWATTRYALPQGDDAK